MISKQFRTLLLFVAVFGLATCNLRAFEWKPVGTEVTEADGINYANTSGDISTYAQGDWIHPEILSLSRDFSKINLASHIEPLLNVVTKTSAKINPLRSERAIVSKARTSRGPRTVISSNTSFATSSTEGADNTLNIYGVLYPDHDSESTPSLDGEGYTISCPLKIDGDVTLEALEADMTINAVRVLETDETAYNTTTYVMPYINPTRNSQLDGEGYAQIYFNAASGKKITVNLNNDLEFSGITPGAAQRGKTIHGAKIVSRSKVSPPAIDMILTFAGTGQTIFKMASGTAIKFMGDIDVSGAVDMTDDDSFTAVGNDAAGTKVFITMEQTEADVNNGINKLIFEHATGTNQRNLVLVGNNSIITYVSTDDTGIRHIPTEETPEPDLANFASMAFDTSNTSAGRMVLFILGAYRFGFEFPNDYDITDPEYEQMVVRYPFNDGAVIVQGHYVEGYTPSEIRETLDYSFPSGGRAIMRTVDDVAYLARSGAPTSTYDPSTSAKRGLLVINDAQSVTKRASDPYLDYWNTTPGEETTGQLRFNGRAPEEIYGYTWSYSNPANYMTIVRNGFILGVNGNLDVYHNTFFDYVAGSINRTDLLAQNDYNETVDAPELTSLETIMKKNPAAFVVDGLDANLFDRVSPELSISPFIAANPALENRHALVTLRGTGAAYFRCSASSAYGYIYNFWRDYIPYQDPASETPEEIIYPSNPLDDPDYDFQTALIVDSSNFDGYRLKDTDNTTHLGQHVVEVEGLLDVNSVPNTTTYDPATLAARLYASAVEKSGIVNMPTILIDYMAQEYATRPLTISALPEDVYERYNSPAMFFNNHASFYNTNIIHSDVTKMIDGVPTDSFPAMFGGERMYFADMRWTYDGIDIDRFRFPEVRLYTSILHLQEGLNTSGVRFVVRDTTGAAGGSNASIVKFYDHGNAYDTDFKGFGRALMFGSNNNIMADSSTNWITEGSYLNIFRKHGLTTNPGSTGVSLIDLSLQNGNQFVTDGFSESEYANQRAHHLILMSTMEKGAANIAIGWPVTSGDDAEGYPYENTLYGDKLIKEVLSEDTAHRFDLNAQPYDDHIGAPQATMTIDGKYMVFSGFDKYGNCTATPIERMDENGKLYVNHGGKITITGTNTAIVETIIAQKAWNDYNYAGTERVVEYAGRVDLPTDQVKFLVNAAVQPYGFTPEMLAYRSVDTDGYVRLSLNNQDSLGATIDHSSKFDQTGGEEVVINWYNRTGDNRIFAPGDRRFSFPSSRATENITAPIARPTPLLYIGSGDDIAQLRVAGATQSNKFMLDITGDAILPAPGHVREFTSAVRQVDMPTDHFVGEGDNAVLFLEYGGRIGLGSRDWDTHSGGNSWTILGQDHVQIVPLGDGIVDLNSDVIIGDKNAIVCSELFSADTKANRLTFRSDVPHKIVIPAGGELDLSSFGQATNRQEIAFGGKVSLVIEAGATIRFPSNPTGGVVLYFNDESELVFQEGSEPQVVTQSFGTAAKADLERIKIVGKGQIWGNKHAKIMVNGNVLVGVQSDARTLVTDVTISLQRESEFNIGTPTVAGGAFQVGNPVSITSAAVNFKLALGDINAKFHIDRLGFFGLGAGVIDKFNKINGGAVVTNNPVVDAAGKATLGEDGNPIFTPDTTANSGAWTVQALYNVGQITLDIASGQFEHNNIADGSSANGSLMAVGPSARNGTDNYVFKVNGALYATISGGGNIMKVPTLGTTYRANVWDYAGPLSTGEQYSILASGPCILDRASDDVAAVTYLYNGKDFGGRTFSFATLDTAFGLLAFKTLNGTPRKKVCWGTSGFDVMGGFVNKDTATGVYPTTKDAIRRLFNPVVQGASVRTPLLAGAAGVRSDGNIDASTFGVLKVE